MTSAVKQFYDINQFPGHYTRQELNYHIPSIKNPYLEIIDQYVQDCDSVLDVGCGTGLISNLFALKYPNKQVTSVDFADSIQYAQTFACDNSVDNVDYHQADFLSWNSPGQFDCVLCQGVLHHIPDWQSALNKLMHLVREQGLLILGLYHPAGKLMKRYIDIDYKESLLFVDQEQNPFELSFTKSQIKKMVLGFDLIDQWPTMSHSLKHPIQFSRNGGLTTYIFKKL